MARSRSIEIIEQAVPGLQKLVPSMEEMINQHWEAIHDHVQEIKDRYWQEMREQVEDRKHRQNNSVAKLPSEVFLKSTYILYRPNFRMGKTPRGESVRFAWVKAKNVISNGSATAKKKTATTHIPMNETASNLMPSYYHPSKFKFPVESEWQKEIVLRYEREIAYYRVLTWKLMIAAKEYIAINQVLNKTFDNNVEVQDPNATPQNQTDNSDPLMAAVEALKAADDDINAISTEFAKLLVDTEPELLEAYNVDPDVIHMYLGQRN